MPVAAELLLIIRLIDMVFTTRAYRFLHNKSQRLCLADKHRMRACLVYFDIHYPEFCWGIERREKRGEICRKRNGGIKKAKRETDEREIDGEREGVCTIIRVEPTKDSFRRYHIKMCSTGNLLAIKRYNKVALWTKVPFI